MKMQDIIEIEHVLRGQNNLSGKSSISSDKSSQTMT